MKEIVIIILILIIIFVGEFYIQKYLSNTSASLISKLEDLKQIIDEKSIEKDEIVAKSDEIYSEWKDINEKWSVIILHNEIDLIETSLIRMKSKIKTGKIDDSVEDIDSSIFLVNHIKEKEETRLKNIF